MCEKEREKEKKMEEKEDEAQQANGTIMMRKYLLAKHEIMCIQWPRHVCKRANETEGERESGRILNIRTHTHNACIHVREACLKMRPFFVYKWRPIKKMSHENNAKILHFFSSSTSSSSSSSLYSFACNCVLKKCMVDLFNSRDWLSSSLRGSYSTTAPATSSISAIVYNHRVSVGTFSFSLSLPCT